MKDKERKIKEQSKTVKFSETSASLSIIETTAQNILTEPSVYREMARTKDWHELWKFALVNICGDDSCGFVDEIMDRLSDREIVIMVRTHEKVMW